MLNCKKCNGRKFRSVSLLRKHQWKAHPEFYKNNGKNIAIVKLVAKKELTALEALNKFKEQRDLLDKMISLMAGMLENHTK